jgi:hypothetical protein
MSDIDTFCADLRDKGFNDMADSLPQLVADCAKETIRGYAEQSNKVIMTKLSDTTMVDEDGCVWNKGGTVLSTINGHG